MDQDEADMHRLTARTHVPVIRHHNSGHLPQLFTIFIHHFSPPSTTTIFHHHLRALLHRNGGPDIEGRPGAHLEKGMTAMSNA